MYWREPTNYASTNNNNNTDAQTDYPLGYIYIGNNSPCCPSHPLRCSYSSLRMKGVVFFFGGVRGLECPWLCPHPPHPPKPSAEPLYVPPPAPPWGRWQPSTVKGRGSHDGFHRWSVEIAGKDLSSVEQQRTRESQREIWVEKREMGRSETKREGEKEGEREREREEGGEGGACLRRVACRSAKSCLLGRLKSLGVFEVKNVKVWHFFPYFGSHFNQLVFYLSAGRCSVEYICSLVIRCCTDPASPQTSLSFRPIVLSCCILSSSDVAVQRSEVKQMSLSEPSVKDLIVSWLGSQDFRGATLSLLLKPR